jgi:hypothetical protein
MLRFRCDETSSELLGARKSGTDAAVHERRCGRLADGSIVTSGRGLGSSPSIRARASGFAEPPAGVYSRSECQHQDMPGKRQHYVPKFLIRRFAIDPTNKKSLIVKLEKRTGKPSRVNPLNELVIGH